MKKRRRSTLYRNKGISFQNWAKGILEEEKGNVIMKKGAPVRIALVYPNVYEVGMASLGFQTVYRLFNEHPEVRCERAFFREEGAPLTLETGSRLNDFDMVGFSLSFELDIPNVLAILHASGLKSQRENRHPKDPIVFLGGVVAGLNPSPLLLFVDGLLAGEGEGLIEWISDTLFAGKEKGWDKDRILLELSSREGIFIPRYSRTVKRNITRSLEQLPVYTPIVSPRSHFGDLFVVETGRGCIRKCLFCAAQKIYMPYRFRSAEAIIETVSRFNPGAKRIGLEGAGLSDYPELEKLSSDLHRMGYGISFSSLRADRVNDELIHILDESGTRSFTMAPEAGSDELRRAIGKQIDETVLFHAARQLSLSRISALKLYFLIGLPGETDGDIDALIGLVREMNALFLTGRRKRGIRVSVNAFIPKPFTEYQWAPMAEEEELQIKKQRIRQALKKQRAITLDFQSTKEEILQGLLSVGCAGMGPAILDAVEKNSSVIKALKKFGIDRSFLHRERPKQLSMPWDFIDSGLPKEFLWTKYRESLENKVPL